MSNVEKRDIKLFNPSLPQRILDRFWANIIKYPGCWEWTGGIKGNGYGLIVFRDGKHKVSIHVHRLSYYLEHGPFQNHLYVLHSCDNRKCVNPKHLRVGTQSENIKEAFIKGRMKPPGLKGSEHGHAVQLEEHEIEEITNSNETYKSLAKKFNVSVSTVNRVKNRKGRWRNK